MRRRKKTTTRHSTCTHANLHQYRCDDCHMYDVFVFVETDTSAVNKNCFTYRIFMIHDSKTIRKCKLLTQFCRNYLFYFACHFASNARKQIEKHILSKKKCLTTSPLTSLSRRASNFFRVNSFQWNTHIVKATKSNGCKRRHGWCERKHGRGTAATEIYIKHVSSNSPLALMQFRTLTHSPLSNSRITTKIPRFNEVFGFIRANMRPWSEFFNFGNFKAIGNLQRLTARFIRNLTYFQMNYVAISFVLILYCL